MRPETRAARYLEAGSMPAQWALLSSPRRAYAAHLVRDYGTPVRIAIEHAYIFGFDPYAYDYRAGKSVRDQWPPRSDRPRHWYAEYSPYGVATLSDGDTLTRFATKQERDNWCSEDPEHRASVTLAEVRHRYDVRKFGSDCHTISHRAGYQL